MNILNFISDLRTVDVVILVLVVFIFIFLLFLTSSLMKKNKELRQELTKVNYNKDIHSDIMVNEEVLDEEKVVDTSNEDISLVDELIEDDILLEPKKEEDISEILEDMPEIEETGPYKKNVLRELSARGQTSPVNIGSSTVDISKVKVTSYVKKEDDEEVSKRNEKIDEMDNQTFIEEISKRMEDELKPQTIELTDYEKKQEEEAIISYQELLKAKDRIYRITDDEEIDTFIDELKEFRTNLE